MKCHFPGRSARTRPPVVLLLAVMIWTLGAVATRADQVQMQNGDRYSGKVVSLTADTLVLQSEVAGTLRLPRAGVASLTLGTNTTATLAAAPRLTNAPLPGAAAARTNTGTPEMAGALRQLGLHTNLIQQVQAQFLGDAGPEANAKFNELLSGLMSGKLTVTDLRAEAQSAANQMRDVRKELGDDGGVMLDGYLAILDHFLKETAPAPGASTNLDRPALNSK